MADKNNLNISLGVDVSNLKKGFDEAVKVTTKSSNEIERFIAAKMDSMADVFEKGTATSMKNALKNILTGLRGFGEQASPYMDIVAEQFHAIDEAQKKVDAGLAASSGERHFSAMAAAANVASAGFTAVTAAQELLGAESEDLQKAMLKVQSAMALGQAIGQVKDLEKEFMLLKATLIANPILAVVAGVIALGAAAVATAASLDDLSAAENAQLEISANAAKAVAEEGIKIKLLAAIYDDANIPLDARKQAYTELKNINPKLVEGLNKEGSSTKKATDAAADYTAELIKQAKVKAGLELVTEAYKKLVEAQIKLTRKAKGDLTAGDYIKQLAFMNQGLSAQQLAVYGASQEFIELGQQYKEIEQNAINLGKSTVKTAEDVRHLAGNMGFSAAAASNLKEEVKKLDYSLKQRGSNLTGSDLFLMDYSKSKFDAMIRRVEADIAQAQIEFEKNPIEVPVVLVKETDKKKGEQKHTGSIDDYAKRQEERASLAQNLVENSFSSTATSLADALTAGLQGGNVENILAKTFGNILGMMGDFMVEYGLKTEMIAALMSKIQAAIALNPAMALPYAIAMVAGGIALKGIAGSFGQGKMNKFADGGVLNAPTMGLMAEYPNANINKEIVTPENLMAKIVRENSGGGMNGQLVAVVKGNDLHFILEQANKNRRRG